MPQEPTPAPDVAVTVGKRTLVQLRALATNLKSRPPQPILNPTPPPQDVEMSDPVRPQPSAVQRQPPISRLQVGPTPGASSSVSPMPPSCSGVPAAIRTAVQDLPSPVGLSSSVPDGPGLPPRDVRSLGPPTPSFDERDSSLLDHYSLDTGGLEEYISSLLKIRSELFALHETLAHLRLGARKSRDAMARALHAGEMSQDIDDMVERPATHPNAPDA